VGDKWYLCGGSKNATENTNDLWCFDFSKMNWTHIIPKSKCMPPSLDSHTGCLYIDEKGNQKIIVFGGFVGGQYGEPWNQVIEFNLSSEEWIPHYKEPLQLNSGSGPAPRCGHTAVVLKNDMYVFGGTDGDIKFNDLWKYDLKQKTWSQLKFENAPAVMFTFPFM
jgi:hypothetical protein